MEEKIKIMFEYIQERCLWQFFSRNWDREDNINSIMNNVVKIISGEECDRSTNIKNSHYADAKELVRQLKEKYDWFNDLSVSDVKLICDKVIEMLIDVTVINSLNAERTDPKY